MKTVKILNAISMALLIVWMVSVFGLMASELFKPVNQLFLNINLIVFVFAWLLAFCIGMIATEKECKIIRGY